MKKAILCAALLLVSAYALGQGYPSPPQPQQNGTPSTNARRTDEGLRGWVLVTADADWQTKWESDAKTTPNFTRANELARGSKAFVLIFFSNPQLDSAGHANLTCDIQLTRPNGTLSTHQSDSVCFRDVLHGDPHETYLAAPVIGFSADQGDPAGTWKVDVVLRDNNRHTSLPLKTSFVLKDR
jgi:hypothetical protein